MYRGGQQAPKLSLSALTTSLEPNKAAFKQVIRLDNISLISDTVFAKISVTNKISNS